jgi:hypothetical protein
MLPQTLPPSSGLDRGEIMLAAAHNGALRAARTAGLATAFIARPAEYGPQQASDLTPTGDLGPDRTSPFPAPWEHAPVVPGCGFRVSD